MGGRAASQLRIGNGSAGADAPGSSIGPADDGAADNGAGERDAQARWVRDVFARHERALVQYAAHITGDADRARDVVQDAFVRLCDQDRERIGPRVAEWLYTVCRNGAIDVRRKERRMRLLGEDQADSFIDDELAPPESAERHDAMSSVLRALEDLPTNQQECIRLKFQGNLSYKQIAEVTSLTATNVGFLIHTGLKALRGRLASPSPAGEAGG